MSAPNVCILWFFIQALFLFVLPEAESEVEDSACEREPVRSSASSFA